MPVGALGQLVEVVEGAALLAAGELRVGDRGGEAVVALLPACEHEQMRALGIGDAGPRRGRVAPRRGRGPGVEGELGTEHGLQLHRLGGLGEAGDAVEAVVVGDGERVQAEALGLFNELGG